MVGDPESERQSAYNEVKRASRSTEPPFRRKTATCCSAARAGEQVHRVGTQATLLDSNPLIVLFIPAATLHEHELGVDA